MNINPNFDWNDAAVRELKTRWGSGESGAQIADALGTGRSSVMGKIHRLDLQRTDEGERQAQRLANAARRENARKPRPKHTAPRPAPQPPVEPVMEIEDTSDADIPIKQRRTLLQLEPHHCRWPVGTPGAADFFFCGGTAIEDRPYCRTHHRRAHGGGTYSKRQATRVAAR